VIADADTLWVLAARWYEEQACLDEVAAVLPESVVPAWAEQAAGLLVAHVPPWPPFDDPGLLRELTPVTRKLFRRLCALPTEAERAGLRGEVERRLVAEVRRRQRRT
jgi:hypothetical protein